MRKRLQLHRETLRHLEQARMTGVNGGTANCTNWGVTCTCPTDQTDPTNDTGPIRTGPNYGGCPSNGANCTVGC